tara:strand:- start:4053 stop:4436 length:384 start_codon:yes stop_codon:yes gene_type:complete
MTYGDPNEIRRVIHHETVERRRLKWFPAESQQLIKEAKSGMSVEEMAIEHGRSEASIKSRLWRLDREGSIEWSTRRNKASPKQVAPPTPTPGINIMHEVTTLVTLRRVVTDFLNGEATLDDLKEASE